MLSKKTASWAGGMEGKRLKNYSMIARCMFDTSAKENEIGDASDCSRHNTVLM